MAIDDTIIGRLFQGSIYEHATKWAIPLSILQLILSFLLMGAISEDYLATNVNLLCNSSNLLVSILMAFCNSSPDLISNFVAWLSAAKDTDGVKSTADTLALSEVLGSCGTIMFIAVGCILIGFNKIYKEINRQKFERDLSSENNNGNDFTSSSAETAELLAAYGDEMNTSEYKQDLRFLLVPLINKLSNDLFFFSIGMGFVLLCCILTSISMFVCILLLVLYTGFMLNNIRHHKKHGNKTIDYESAVEDVIELQPTSDIFEEGQQQEADNLLKLQAEPSNFFAGDNFEFFLSVLEGDDTNVWRDPVESTIFDSNQGIELQLSNNRVSALRDTHDVSFEHYSDNPLEQNANQVSPIVYEDLKKHSFGGFQSSIKQYSSLLVENWEKFKKKSTLKKAISVLTVPVLLLVTLTCPRFNRSIPEDNKRFLFLALQSYMSVFFSFFSFMIFINKLVIWPLIVFPLTFGSALLYIQIKMKKKYKKITSLSLNSSFAEFNNDEDMITNDSNQQKADTSNVFKTMTLLDEFRKELSIFSIVGILNSILWIVVMSNNLIGTIEYYQEIFNISETILGMTFFAWGNSVPDILTNVAVLKLYNNDVPAQLKNNSTILFKWQVQSLLKYCHISLVTCISSSTINSMIGIGFNALIAICLKKPFKFAWYLTDISLKTYIHLIITSSSILVLMLLLAIVLKVTIKYEKIFNKYILDAYFTNKQLLIESIESRQENALQPDNASGVKGDSLKNFNEINNNQRKLKYKHNKTVKYIGLSLISIWISVTLINVLVEVVM